METRVCGICTIEKPLTKECFQQKLCRPRKDGSRKLYWFAACRACVNQREVIVNRDYKKRNRSTIAAKQRVYHDLSILHDYFPP
jgi:hypothetical protein